MMKQHILIMLFTLAGLAGMAQTNEPLPSGAVQFSNQLWIVPSDSTIWTGDVFEGKFVNLGSWHKVDSLLALKADASDLSDFYTQSQIDAFLALKADESALDDFYTKLEVDGLLGGYVPTSRTVNGKALTGNIILQMADIPNLVTTLGDKADLSDLDGVIRSGDNNSELNNDAGYVTAATAPVTSVNTKTGAVVIDKGDLLLGNVDNTSDANKPVSTAQQAALDLKEDVANKRTSLTSPNNTTYPTTQAVSDAIAAVPVNTYTSSNGITQVGNDFRPVYGTDSGTVAQGNDSRINNGQIAYLRGDWNSAGLWVNAPSGTWDGPVAAGKFRTIASSTSSPIPGLSSFGAYFPHVTETYGTYLSGRNDRFFFRSLENGVLLPFREVWHDGNFNPGDYIPMSQRGAANGVPTLDGSGKVPFSQLPTSNPYKGTWNASTNTPSIADGVGTTGDYYRVSVGGTQNLGSGNITFTAGDDVIYNGSIWQRVPSGVSATNLAIGTRTATDLPITNSNGTGVNIPIATTSLAGLMSSSDKTKLNSALTSYTETDPTVPSNVKAISGGNISNWNTAYSWGDHAGRYMGLTSGVSVISQSHADLNTVVGNRFIYGGSSAANGPGGGLYPFLLQLSYGSSGEYKVQFGGRGDRFIFRTSDNNDFGTPWREFWHTGNLTPSDYLQQSNFTWPNLSGKPSTFTPSAHTHSGADITSGTVPFARLPTGTTSSTVAVGNHTHTLAGDITGSIGSTVIANSAVTFAKIQNVGANTIMGRSAAGTGDVAELTATQVRTMLNVANGATSNSTDATLLNRANHTGTQAISTVSGLQSSLDNRWVNAPSGTWDDSEISGRLRTISSATGSPTSGYTYGGFAIPIVSNSHFAYLAMRDDEMAFKTLENGVMGGWNTIYHSGNFNPSDYAQLGTGSTQVRNNSQLDARYLQSGDLPTVNNGTLSLSTGTGLTGSATFTANQSGNSTFTVAAASGYAIPTTSQVSDWNSKVPASRTINGKALSSNVTLTNADIGSEPAFSKNTAFNKNFGTAAGTVAQGNDSRIVNAVPNTRTINGKALSANVTLTAADVSAMPTSWTITAGNGLTGGGSGAANRTLTVGAGDGIMVTTSSVSVDATVARRDASNSFSGVTTFTQPVTGAQATASNHFVTKAQMDAAVTNIIKIDTPFSTAGIAIDPGETYSFFKTMAGVSSSATVIVNFWSAAGTPLPTAYRGLIIQASVYDSGEIEVYITNADPISTFSGTVNFTLTAIN